MCGSEVVGILHGPAESLELAHCLRADREQIVRVVLQPEEHEVEVVDIDRRGDGESQWDLGTGVGDGLLRLGDVTDLRHAAMGEARHDALLAPRGLINTVLIIGRGAPSHLCAIS